MHRSWRTRYCRPSFPPSTSRAHTAVTNTFRASICSKSRADDPARFRTSSSGRFSSERGGRIEFWYGRIRRSRGGQRQGCCHFGTGCRRRRWLHRGVGGRGVSLKPSLSVAAAVAAEAVAAAVAAAVTAAIACFVLPNRLSFVPLCS